MCTYLQVPTLWCRLTDILYAISVEEQKKKKMKPFQATVSAHDELQLLSIYLSPLCPPPYSLPPPPPPTCPLLRLHN